MPKSKGLSPDRAEAAREYIRALIDRDFGGVAWGFTKKVGVSQATIAAFLNGKGGIGLNVLEKVADYAHATVDEIIGRSGVPMGRDLDRLERALVDRLADVHYRKRARSPSGFPPAPPAANQTVVALHGKRRKKS